MINKKYIGIFVCAFALFCTLPAVTITNQVRLTQNGTIQFEGSTNDNFETTLNVIDPFSDNLILLQAGSGTIAFLSDINGDGVFQAQNTIYVDASNSGTETGTITFPFNTIPEGLTASSLNDLIIIAPGTYAEALVFPHDLYVDGHGVLGLLSIDISSGSPDGMLGDIEYHAQSSIVHGGSNAVTNGTLVLFANAVGATQTDPYAVGLLSAVYDFVAGSIDYDQAGFDVLSLYGIGLQRPHLKSTGIVLEGFIDDQSFKNLHLESVGQTSGFAAMESKTTGDPITGTFENLTSTNSILLASFKEFDGVADNIDVDGDVIISHVGVSHDGHLTNIKARGTKGTEIKGKAGSLFYVDILEGEIRGNAVFDGYIRIAKGVNMTFSQGFDLTNGFIFGDKVGSLVGAIDAVIRGVGFRDEGQPAVGRFGLAVLRNNSIFKDFAAGTTGSNGSVIEENAEILNTFFDGGSLIISRLSSSTQNKGIMRRCTFKFSSGVYGTAVGTGAQFLHCDFTGKSGEAIEFAHNIIGRSLLGEWGQAATYKYEAATNTLVLPLTSQPQESDGAGSHQGIASATTFNSYVRRVDPLLSALETNTYLFEVFLDVADIHGFGTNVWVFRSSDAQIDIDLGAPGSDITTTDNALIAVISLPATITVSDCTFEGIPFSPEITISDASSQTKVVTLIADDTVISMGGFVSVTLDSDSVTATDRTFSFDLISLLSNEIYTIYFVDATDAAEWIDNGADSAKLNGTMTFGEDDTILFIYDGAVIRELSRSPN